MKKTRCPLTISAQWAAHERQKRVPHYTLAPFDELLRTFNGFYTQLNIFKHNQLSCKV
jgi:hypothetical protein